VRQRQEVQKMLRSLVLATWFAFSASAAIWPEHLGNFARTSVNALPAPADENGREAAEEADYGKFKVSAVRFKDTTGAYAAWLETPGHPLQAGNYVITCSGACPKNLAELAETLPGISHAPLPALASYLPVKNRMPQSPRYIVGPSGLRQNFPQVPESAAAFQFGTEAAIARYRSGKNEATLAVFSYPTPQIARQQLPAFEAIPGAVAKRTGPLVAIAWGIADRQAGEALLNQIGYEASITVNEPLPLVLTPQSTAQMLLAIITLAGIVLGFCLMSGLVFGGLRVLARRFGYTDAGTAMTTLHLSDK
jgi:hypothetical protein